MQNWLALAGAQIAGGRFDDALLSSERVIDQEPENAMAHCVRGIALQSLRRTEEALQSYRMALALDASNIIAANNLGLLLHGLGRDAEALATLEKPCCDDSMAESAQRAVVCTTLAMVQLQLGQPEAAEGSCRRALQLSPDHVPAHNNLAQALKERGRLAESVAQQRIAVRLSPGDARRHSAMLFDLNYLEDLDAEDCAREHRQFGEFYGSPTQSPAGLPNNRDPDRRLRVGYVSPDFRAHSVAFFLEPLLTAYDRGVVEITCYSSLATPDPMTHRLRGHADRWRDVWHLTDNQLSGLIRDDGIDILVDLAGHTANNRLRIFGMRSAPVQVTWLGYPNTTGLREMDYRLTDEWADPRGHGDDWHTERLIRLPRGFLCYKPLGDCPVTPAPSLANGYVTFGSFNSGAKMNERVFDVWGGILAAIPDARLLLKARQLDSADWRRRFVESFARRGIESDRIELRGHAATLNEHLATYDRVDIALDTFPYNGTTTTCEALWMGVPVVALAGNRHAARVGVSLLYGLGLDELVAATPDAYRRVAVTLARDPGRLVAYRSTLRTRMNQAPLTDAAEFARDIEAAYRDMWRAWCG
jgi:predicted O-linked N-acetylglucosamine transferase (SPINDLY family)